MNFNMLRIDKATTPGLFIKGPEVHTLIVKGDTLYIIKTGMFIRNVKGQGVAGMIANPMVDKKIKKYLLMVADNEKEISDKGPSQIDPKKVIATVPLDHIKDVIVGRSFSLDPKLTIKTTQKKFVYYFRYNIPRQDEIEAFADKLNHLRIR